MIAVKVSLNGKKIALAGADDLGVLMTLLEVQDNSPSNLRLDIRGKSTPAAGASEHLEWVGQRLALGDELEIEVVEVDVADEPTSRELAEENAD